MGDVEVCSHMGQRANGMRRWRQQVCHPHTSPAGGGRRRHKRRRCTIPWGRAVLQALTRYSGSGRGSDSSGNSSGNSSGGSHSSRPALHSRCRAAGHEGFARRVQSSQCVLSCLPAALWGVEFVRSRCTPPDNTWRANDRACACGAVQCRALPMPRAQMQAYPLSLWDCRGGV